MKKANKKNLIKEVIWFAFGQSISILCALVLIRLLTESLSVSKYGEIALILSILALVNQIIYGGISLGAGRFYSIANEGNERRDYFAASFWIFQRASYMLFLLSLVAWIILYSLSIQISSYLAMSCFLFSILSGYNNLFNNIQSAARNRIKVALHAGLDGILKIIFALLGIQLCGPEDYVVIAAFSLSSLIVVLSQYIFIRKDYLKRIEGEVTEVSNTKMYLNKLWAFSWPFSAWGFFTWAQLSSDRWSLEIFQSMDSVAYYAVLFEIGYRPITLIIGLIVTFMTPILFEQGTRFGLGLNLGRGRARVEATTRWILLVCLAVSSLIALIAQLIHSWLFGLVAALRYSEVSNYLPWMVLAGGLFATGQVLAVKMMSDLNTLKSLPIKVISSMIGVALNILGAWQFGFVGIIYANVIFSCIYFSMMLFAAKEILNTGR